MAERSLTSGRRSVARATLLAFSAAVVWLLTPALASAAPPANDDFANAVVLSSTLPANESGSLAEATRQSGEPEHVPLGGGKTVWYRWKPTVDTTVAVGTCGSPSFAGVAVYGQGPVNSLGPRLGTESGCLNGTSAIVHADANHDYWIAVEDVAIGSDAGVYALKLEVAGSLAGRVTNESSAPVDNHCVRVLDPATGTAVVTPHTDSDGRWSVELPPASYQVRFDGCTSGGPYAREYWQSAVDIDAATTIPLAPGQARTGVDAQLEPAASIAGDVTRPGGEFVNNVCVTVFDPDHPDTEVASTTTDVNGHYRITNLAATSYKLRFDPGCTLSTDLKAEYYNDKGTFATANLVTLSAGQDLTSADVLLGDGGSISGTVRDAGLNGIEDICVSAAPVGGGVEGGTQTAANGSYTVSGLDPGNYVVRFSDCNTSTYATEYYDDSPDAAGADPVPVAREQDVTAINATLQQNGSITGTVTGPADEALQNICAVAIDAGDQEVSTGTTDADGDYEIAGLAPGSYRVHFVDCADGAFVDEYYDDEPSLEAATPVTVQAGQAHAGVDAELASAGSITGTVSGPGGAPVAGVCASALNADGQELAMGGTDESGTYFINHLSPGLYRVIFRDCGTGGASLATEFYDNSPTYAGAEEVAVQEGLQTEDVNAQLAAGGSISGDVTAEGGDPAADVCISAFPAADAIFPVATTNTMGDGSYTLTGLATGSYKLYFDGSCSLDQLSEEFYADASTFATAAAVSVTAPGEHAGIDVELTATQAPTVTIVSGPSGPTADATPTFTFSRTGGGGIECSIDTGSANFGPCSNALAHTPASNLANGPFTFRVRVSNAAGEQTVTRTFSVDTTPPSVAVTSGPSGPTNMVRPSFDFTSEAGSSVQCSVDTGTAAYGPCSGAGTHQPGSDLAQGSYTVRVRATDGVGNSAVATRTFSVDTTKPTIAITGGPNGPTNNLRPTFTFNPEAGATVECSIDTGTASYAACSGPGSTHTPGSDLTQGAKTFRVRATDTAGNTEVATRTFTVDSVAPDTTIATGPAEGTTITTAGTSFTFTSTEGGGTFECKLDSGSFGSCTSPRNLTSLQNGSHTFSVRATDAAGNVDATPATRTFTVDTSDHTPPETSITTGPADGATVTTANAGFGFSADESGSTFECKLDSGGFESCSSPRNLSGLENGSHTFSVRATDPNGNTDPTPATRTFTVAIDSTPPDTVIDSGPNGTITVDAATIVFHATESGSTFECKLDSGGFQPCTSPRALSGLANGAHTFAVRATDAAGNVDASPATQTFTVAVTTTPPPDPPDPPDTSACDAATSQLASAQKAMSKAKAKLKKAKSKGAKKKAKAAVKKAKQKVSAANSAVASAC